MLPDELSKKLDNPDEEVRRQAVEELKAAPFVPEIRQFLKKAMGDASWRVRKSAVNVIVLLQDDRTISSLLELLVDSLHSEDNVGLRNSAVETLVIFGRKAVPYLIQNLDDKDHDARKFIADILGDIWTAKGGFEADLSLVEEQGVVDALLGVTGDTDENVRLSAVEALGKIASQKAVDALLGILEKGDTALKFTALEALGNIGRPVPMNGVYNVCKDKLLKRAVYDFIGKVGGPEAVPYLVAGLKETSISAREAAIAAITRLASSIELPKQRLASQISQIPSSAVMKIAASLESHDLNVRKGAAFILGLTGKGEAAPPLIRALGFDEIADEAGAALIELGDEVLDAIINAYQGRDEKVRGLACYVLGEIGSKKHVPASIKQGAEKILSAATRDGCGHVRGRAAVAFAKVSPEKAIPEVINLFEDEFEDVRNCAVEALCLIAGRFRGLVTAAILPLLSSDNPYVRENAITLLGRISRVTQAKLGSEDIERIRLAIKDDNPAVRKAAVLAMEGRGNAKYIQDIIFALADEDKDVRLAAAKALGNVKSKQAVDALILTLKSDDDIWVRAASVEGLGKIGKGSAVKAIKELAYTTDEGILAVAAIEAMARIAAKGHETAEEVKPWVAKCLFHSDPEVIKVAVDVLAKIDKDAAAALILPLLEHPNWDVRAQVVSVLSKGKNHFVKDRLEARLKVETDELVKQKIAEALKGRDACA